MRTLLTAIFPSLFPPYSTGHLTLFEIHRTSIFVLYQEGARGSVVREFGPISLYTPW